MRYIMLRDLEVSRIGLGAMGMSHGCTGSGTDDAESIRTVHRALEPGVTLTDTAADSVTLTGEQLDKLSGLPPAAGDTHAEAQAQMLER